MYVTLLSYTICSSNINFFNISHKCFSDYQESESLEYNDKISLNEKNSNKKLHIGFNDSYKFTSKSINEKNIFYIHIDDNNFEYVPDEISRFNNLKVLEIYSDQFINYSDEIGKLLNLRNLILENITINKIPTTIKNLKNLRILIIKNDKHGLSDFNYMRRAIENNCRVIKRQNLQKFEIIVTPINEINEKRNKIFYNGILNRTIFATNFNENINLYKTNLRTKEEKNLTNKKNLKNKTNEEISLNTNQELIFYKNEFKMLEILNITTRYQTFKIEKNLPNIYFEPVYNFIKEIPNEICLLEKLEVIEILNQKIKKIPECINNMKNLKIINLSNNVISLIPDKVFELNNLEILNLSNNEISVFPEIILSNNLLCLNLSKNIISEIPNSIDKLNRLKSLDLSDNQICDLPVTLGNLINLNRLDLSSNFFSNLPDTIENLQKLEYLILKNINFDNLNKNISKLVNLKVLNMRNTSELEKNGCKNLDLDFTMLRNLEFLDLRQLFYKRIHRSILKLQNNNIRIYVNVKKILYGDEEEFVGKKSLKKDFYEKINL